MLVPGPARHGQWLLAVRDEMNRDKNYESQRRRRRRRSRCAIQDVRGGRGALQRPEDLTVAVRRRESLGSRRGGCVEQIVVGAKKKIRQSGANARKESPSRCCSPWRAAMCVRATGKVGADYREVVRVKVCDETGARAITCLQSWALTAHGPCPLE